MVSLSIQYIKRISQLMKYHIIKHNGKQRPRKTPINFNNSALITYCFYTMRNTMIQYLLLLSTGRNSGKNTSWKPEIVL